VIVLNHLKPACKTVDLLRAQAMYVLQKSYEYDWFVLHTLAKGAAAPVGYPVVHLWH